MQWAFELTVGSQAQNELEKGCTQENKAKEKCAQ